MVHAGNVFLAGIHPSITWMSGSFKSMRWNACVYRLHLSLYFHPKEFLGMESEPMLSATEKSPLPESQRRVKPARLHQAGQPAQHTTHWAPSRRTASPTHYPLSYIRQDSQPNTLPTEACRQGSSPGTTVSSPPSSDNSLANKIKLK